MARRPNLLPAGLLLLVCLLATADPVRAQAPGSGPAPAPPIPIELDVNLINLPTTRSLSRHHGYFRLTHRFARDLRRGPLGDLASSLFGVDQGAVMGLEYRFAVTAHLQAGVGRSVLSKTVQTFARWDAVRQGDGRPASVSVTGSLEGQDNLRAQRQPGIGITISRALGDRLALYLSPAFVAHTRVADVVSGHEGHDHGAAEALEQADHDNTWFAGMGARVRFAETGYVVGEYSPRIAGYDPNRGVWGVGLEKRTGGHTLQLNLTNAFGTTPGQIARGGSAHDIYLGFNITRKF